MDIIRKEDKKMPSTPSTYYKNDFFSEVRTLFWGGSQFMPQEDLHDICIKERITSQHRLKRILQKYDRIPSDPIGHYNDQGFFKRIRKELGTNFARDMEWLPKENAIAVFIEERVTSGLCLNRRGDKFFDKYPRIPRSPVKAYDDKKMFRTVRDALGIVYSKDRTWIPVDEAIAICAQLGITCHGRVKEIRDQHPNIPISPTKTYNDPDFFKKVRGEL
jgi:hypothetical protein